MDGMRSPRGTQTAGLPQLRRTWSPSFEERLRDRAPLGRRAAPKGLWAHAQTFANSSPLAAASVQLQAAAPQLRGVAGSTLRSRAENCGEERNGDAAESWNARDRDPESRRFCDSAAGRSFSTPAALSGAVPGMYSAASPAVPANSGTLPTNTTAATVCGDDTGVGGASAPTAASFLSGSPLYHTAPRPSTTAPVYGSAGLGDLGPGDSAPRPSTTVCGSGGFGADEADWAGSGLGGSWDASGSAGGSWDGSSWARRREPSQSLPSAFSQSYAAHPRSSSRPRLNPYLCAGAPGGTAARLRASGCGRAPGLASRRRVGAAEAVRRWRTQQGRDRRGFGGGLGHSSTPGWAGAAGWSASAAPDSPPPPRNRRSDGSGEAATPAAANTDSAEKSGDGEAAASQSPRQAQQSPRRRNASRDPTPRARGRGVFREAAGLFSAFEKARKLGLGGSTDDDGDDTRPQSQQRQSRFTPPDFGASPSSPPCADTRRRSGAGDRWRRVAPRARLDEALAAHRAAWRRLCPEYRRARRKGARSEPPPILAADASRAVMLYDIPWPDDVLAALRSLRPGDRSECRSAVRELQRCWHPDKFDQLIGHRLSEEDATEVRRRVTQVAQQLNAIHQMERDAADVDAP